VYHDGVGIAGLHYIALGVGLMVGSQFNAIYMDRIYALLKSRNGGVGRPEFRLRAYQCSILFPAPKELILFCQANIVPGTILLPTGLLVTGWAAQKHVFWLVPDVVSDLNYPYSARRC
jgi:hypothetical protein